MTSSQVSVSSCSSRSSLFTRSSDKNVSLSSIAKIEDEDISDISKEDQDYIQQNLILDYKFIRCLK